MEVQFESAVAHNSAYLPQRTDNCFALRISGSQRTFFSMQVIIFK